ncbi:MAG: fibronectin type domain protein [Myxococcaceae bacterium]|nr:fibronectin type domain protein [Myxococcaceae bacterium]
MALLLASLCGVACTSPTDAEVIPVVPVPSGDAAVALALAADGAAQPPIREVTIQVVGLTGAGVTLRLGQSEDYTVRADGSYQVALHTPVSTVNALLLAQPQGQGETCELDELSSGAYALTCRMRDYALSGTVEGLEGSGLVLTSQSGEALAISASGAFAFSQRLADGAPYEVSASGAISGPRQTCAVSGGSGHIAGADSAVKVTCATETYSITAHVSGLTESGLSVKLGDGSVLPVPQAGSFTYQTKFPDGYQFSLDIGQQPTTGSQRCYVQGGQGTLDGADAVVEIVCSALGGLRISEVGACPYSNSSCWFEVVNVNPQHLPEQLGFYKVRTTALGAKAYEWSHLFGLPELTLPYLGRVVIQASTAGTLPDGNNVVHIADAGVVPWWSSDGFVELLGQDGLTTDFVRFGRSAAEPQVGGSWESDATGRAVQGLPTGAQAYGYSIAHSAVVRPVSSPDDWSLHAFSTYGGPNDVSSDLDADADGIPDSAEQPGATFAGIDVYAMGARSGQKDVFIEIDRMDSTDAAVVPRKEALLKLVSVYDKHNIAVHFDVGNLFAPSFDPANFNLGGGDVVPFSKGIALGGHAAGLTSLYDIKALHMEAARRSFFYYQLFAWSQQADGSGGSSGIGELPGNDSIVTLGGFALNVGSKLQTNLLINYQAATIMHELGHNLGLHHGGGDEQNRKPNYVSVMNYLYSPLGLPAFGVKSEGDRYDLYQRCSLTSVQQLSNPPTGDVGKFVLEYSDGLSADVDETDLLEQDGLGRSDSIAVDYNCNGKVDAPYSRDLNADGSLGLLSDNDDWASLSFVFRRTASGSENGSDLTFRNPGLRNDVSTADAAHKTDRPCGQLDGELLADTRRAH